jgi:hypothetical protein
LLAFAKKYEKYHFDAFEGKSKPFFTEAFLKNVLNPSKNVNFLLLAVKQVHLFF